MYKINVGAIYYRYPVGIHVNKLRHTWLAAHFRSNGAVKYRNGPSTPEVKVVSAMALTSLSPNGGTSGKLW